MKSTFKVLFYLKKGSERWKKNEPKALEGERSIYVNDYSEIAQSNENDHCHH